jgi:poly(3-hydroxybutyrate) depolymerase
VDGEPRSFVLDVPRREGSEKLPLLLSFHGIGGDPSSLSEVTGIGDRAHMRRFLAVHPRGENVRLGLRFGPGWSIDPSPNRDVELVEAIIESLGSEYCIDGDRVYAAGFSNGAHLAHVLACMLPSRIAAFAAVGGGLNRMAERCGDGGPVPAAIIHGREDKVVGISDGIAAQEFWQKRNSATAMDSAGKTCVKWADLAGRTPVLYCNVQGVGHWWPLVDRGDPLDATTVILDFFGLGGRSLSHIP